MTKSSVDQHWQVRAPASGLEVLVRESRDGVSLHVSRAGTPVLDIGPLGMRSHPDEAAASPVVTGRRNRKVDESFTTTAGKSRTHRHRAHEATFEIESGASRLELDVRVSDDGVGYRHRLLGSGEAAITDEPTVFTSTSPEARVWLAPYTANYEGLWRGDLPVGDLPAGGSYGFPVLLETAGGSWCLLTEAAVDGTYAASQLVSDGAGGFRLRLPQDRVVSQLPWTTPWRVVVIGSLAEVVESDLVQALNPPSRIDDASWILPGRVAWSWWSQKYSPTDPDIQRAYVDYAAAQGWEYVLVDARWDPDWLPDLVSYASSRSVGVLVWSHWSDLSTRQRRRELLPRWRSWGVAGIKVDFMDSDIQQRMAWYEELAADAAEHRLMVNYHGSTLPKGRERTWPHIMTYEGILGAEHYLRRAEADEGYLVMPTPGPDPEHNTIVPFTRNVVGSMDYTPTTFSTVRRPTSLGHELALSVVFESGWQHFADSIETYTEHPLAEAFLALVPAAWDETRLLAGHPGEHVVIARRSGYRWFIGGITAGLPRTIRVPLHVLPSGPHTATIVEDGPDAALAQRSLQVTGDDGLVVELTHNGGFAATCEPVTRTTDRPKGAR